MAPPPPRQCKVCNSAPSKYKCPSCIIPYCSLACFKKHKEIPCSKPVVPVENLQVNDLPSAKEAAASIKPASPQEKPSEDAVLLKPVISAEKSSPLPQPQRSYYVDDPRHVLPQRQLQSIAASADIRDALKNEEIQQLVLGIDNSPNPELELDKAMSNEVFQNFTDKILSTLSAEARPK